jgi:hypothetical protein
METQVKDAQPWTRDMAWRQGHVLNDAAMDALNLRDATESAVCCAVVITHDCDLANANMAAEPNVEIIVGRLVNAANGNFLWGKAPRILHLPMRRGGELVTVELVATQKVLLPKDALAAYQPNDDFAIEPKALAVMRSWLSSRYLRAAFPDAFVERMRATKFDEKLAKTVEPYGDLISFIYFVLNDGATSEYAEGEPYKLDIVLVFAPGDEPEMSAKRADEVADKVHDTAEARLTHQGKNTGQIVLESCIAVSEDDLPVSKTRLLMHWRLEHMSLRSEAEQPGAPPT